MLDQDMQMGGRVWPCKQRGVFRSFPLLLNEEWLQQEHTIAEWMSKHQSCAGWYLSVLQVWFAAALWHVDLGGRHPFEADVCEK